VNDTARTKIIDCTVGLSPDTPVWPGAPRFHFTQRKTPLGGAREATSSNIAMTPHCGTHIDAPLHFAKGGAAIDALPLDLLIGPCRVIEHCGDSHITRDDLLRMQLPPVTRLLVKTSNSRRLRNGELDETSLSLLPDALDHVMQLGVKLLAVDGFSIGPFGELTHANHIKFCEAGGVIIEVLDLLDVEPGEYHMIALPIKLVGLEAAPARVVLLRPDDVASVLPDNFVKKTGATT
jgi:arylformamidase